MYTLIAKKLVSGIVRYGVGTVVNRGVILVCSDATKFQKFAVGAASFVVGNLIGDICEESTDKMVDQIAACVDNLRNMKGPAKEATANE